MLAPPPARDAFSVGYFCMDLLRVSWGQSPSQSESAVLLEVWNTGGLMQTEAALPADSSAVLTFSGGVARCRITSCAQDDYGYLIEFSTDPGGNWFPAYSPPYLVPKPASSLPKPASSLQDEHLPG
jgi:hypothetical protein